MNNKSRVPALNRCIAILDAIAARPLTTAEIINATQLPRSSVYVLIEEMEHLNLIKPDHEGRYQLWMKLIAYGSRAADRLDLRGIITPHLTTLMESVDCLAVHYGIMDGEKAYYVIKLVNPHASMLIMSREGMEVSLVRAGLGKCLLAYQDEGLREKLLNTLDYIQVSPNSITSAADLRKELAQIRLQGWALDNNENEAEIKCVACPSVNSTRQLQGAISIVGTLNKFRDEELPAVVAQTRQCAASIERSLA